VSDTFGVTEGPTCAERLLGLAARLGADYIFANLGSDHPAFIEGFARMQARGEPMPQVIVCPHEMTALSAAHGYAMVTRRPQLVLVHVDVGTQNLGGSVHNAARGRVPAIIVAGLSPVTENAGLRGGRNEFIHDLQDAPRQEEIVAQYMKWAYQLRSPSSVDGVLLRAVQMATMEPQGPVYLTGAREVWEGEAPETSEPPDLWPTPRMSGLPADAVQEVAAALAASSRPLAITSYLGRNHDAVRNLVRLSGRVGIGVTEVSPSYMNFPGDHPHHLGYGRNTAVEEADLILMLDVDVPWLKSKVRPDPHARIAHIDIDPVKSGMGFWHYPSHMSFQADTGLALGQILDSLEGEPPGSDSRRRWIASRRDRPDPAPATGALTATEVSEAVRAVVHDRTVVVFEAPTATEIVPSVLKLTQPGSYLNSGGTGLGWGINAALGAKLARPDTEVVALVGDGCYQFGVPGSAYWVASAYGVPFLTVIYNNGGWSAPKFSTLGVHPDGVANRNDTFWATMTSGARLADIARASGDVAAFEVSERPALAGTLREALAEVRAGRPAVVDVRIAPFSRQALGRGEPVPSPR
jgi:acetolactate synthase-1/2/3 large subunit